MVHPNSLKAAARSEDQLDLRDSSAVSRVETDGNANRVREQAGRAEVSLFARSAPARDQVSLDTSTTASGRGSQSLRVFTELSLIALRGTRRLPPMAPGVGGFNIRPPPPWPKPSNGAIAGESLPSVQLFGSTRCLPIEPKHLPIETKRVEWGDSPVWLIRSFVVAGLLAVAAMVPAAFHDKFSHVVGQVSEAVSSLYPSASAKWANEPARLVIAAQHGFVNEPLPIGISLQAGSGDETVLIAGLGGDAELSLGTSVGENAWTISARDLDKTFVGAPKDFLGVMTATVNLRSATGRVLDSKVLHLEWSDVSPGEMAAASASSDSRVASLSQSTGREPIPDRAARTDNIPQQSEPAPIGINSDQVVALISLGRKLLEYGDVATARVMFKRAALMGDAQAALEVGMSFDPAFLNQRGVLGIAPDVAQAVEWYKKATASGSLEAARHLKRLDRSLD